MGFVLKDLLILEVRGKVVFIELSPAGEETLRLVNLIVCDCLDVLEEMEIVKYYKNRRDYFVIMPQNDWQPVDLLIEIKKWLKI